MYEVRRLFVSPVRRAAGRFHGTPTRSPQSLVGNECGTDHLISIGIADLELGTNR